MEAAFPLAHLRSPCLRRDPDPQSSPSRAMERLQLWSVMKQVSGGGCNSYSMRRQKDS